MGDRRSKQRCIKDVGMGCVLLNGNVERPVTIRNFSESGLGFLLYSSLNVSKSVSL